MGLTNYTIPNMTGGIDETIAQVAQTVPTFLYGLLLFVFGLIFIGGSSTQKKRLGYADYPMWGLMGAIAIFLVTLLLSLTDGIVTIKGPLFGVVIGITFMFGLWFFLSRGRGEN